MNTLIGFLTGIAASMGLGGGFILIIWLTLFAGLPQTQAQGVNLLFFLPVAFFSAVLHARNRLIEWRIVPFAVFAGIVGAALGSFLSFLLSDGILRTLFAMLIIPVSLREIFHRKKG